MVAVELAFMLPFLSIVTLEITACIRALMDVSVGILNHSELVIAVRAVDFLMSQHVTHGLPNYRSLCYPPRFPLHEANLGSSKAN